MKLTNHIYIKTFATDWRIAHLYEHIILRRVRTYFTAAAGYPDISATCNARTYEQSFIEFTATLTEKKQKRELEKQLHQSFNPTETEVVTALREIEAEEGVRYGYSLQQLTKELALLARTPWTDLKDFMVHDFDSLIPSQAKNEVLYPAGKLTRSFVQISLSLPYVKGSSPEHYQIFPFISQSIGSAIATGLEADLSFHNDAIGGATRNTKGFTSHLKLGTVVAADAEKIEKAIIRTVQNLGSKAALTKLASLTVHNYEVSSLRNLFATWEVFDNTRILAGYTGIRKLVTPANIRDILTSLEVRVRVK